ncbi:hypothetical protein EI94DRAFT_1805255 [Lactarius quietus]|nr:hypothetical protein EI94DRAFT_1805255 [Lactarius quietus]
MTSNAPDPPGAYSDPNPPDKAYSPSKPQGSLPAVVAAVPQDPPTQSPVHLSHYGTHFTVLIDGERRGKPPLDPPTANGLLLDRPPPCKMGLPALSANTGAFMVATPSYAPSTAPTPMEGRNTNPLSQAPPTPANTTPLNSAKGQDASLDDFIKYVHFGPLPLDTANRSISMQAGELRDLDYYTNSFKQELNNAYMGYMLRSH